MLKASPTKLRNGAWGARVQSAEVARGDTIRITTKAGNSWSATVERVLWTGDGVAIVATESGGGGTVRRGAPRGRWTGCRCGSIEDYPRDSDCRTCQHDW